MMKIMKLNLKVASPCSVYRLSIGGVLNIFVNESSITIVFFIIIIDRMHHPKRLFNMIIIHQVIWFQLKHFNLLQNKPFILRIPMSSANSLILLLVLRHDVKPCEIINVHAVYVKIRNDTFFKVAILNYQV